MTEKQESFSPPEEYSVNPDGNIVHAGETLGTQESLAVVLNPLVPVSNEMRRACLMGLAGKNIGAAQKVLDCYDDWKEEPYADDVLAAVSRIKIGALVELGFAYPDDTKVSGAVLDRLRNGADDDELDKEWKDPNTVLEKLKILLIRKRDAPIADVEKIVMAVVDHVTPQNMIHFLIHCFGEETWAQTMIYDKLLAELFEKADTSGKKQAVKRFLRTSNVKRFLDPQKTRAALEAANLTDRAKLANEKVLDEIFSAT